MAKRYYWLKLMKDFFQQPKIKKLRRVAGGDTYTVIYLKMQLLSIENGGKLIFEGIEDTFVDEIALTIDEDADNVRFVLMYLMQHGLLEEVDENEYILPEAAANIGSEAASAERMRRLRERKKEELQGKNATVLITDASHSDANVTKSDIEIERDIDKDKDKDKEREEKRESGETPETPRAQKSSRFKPPTVEEVRAYCEERGNGVDAQRFVDYYEAAGWKRGKTPIKDWRACVRTWERQDKPAQRPAARSAQDERHRVKTDADYGKNGDNFVGW